MCVHIRLHKYKSRSKILDFVDSYNNSLPLTTTGRKAYGQFLRQQHVHLIEHLLELYYLELKRSRVHGQGPEFGERLPSFRTNNIQLAQRLNCCERTIRGLRARLKEAKVIEAECWHGSNSSYEIWLNPDLLYMSAAETQSENAAEFFARPDGRPASRSLQTLPHTVTSLPVLDTNPLNKLSGAPFTPTTDNQSVTDKQAVENSDSVVDNAEAPVENPHGAADGIPETGYRTSIRKTKDTSPPELRAAPPQNSPDTLAEVTAGLEHSEQLQLERLVQRMWATARNLLYADWWLADSEVERARARLAEYLRYAPPRNWKAGASEVMERIALVRKWIDRHYPDGDYRMNLPANYFDVRNSTRAGFIRTKQWFREHKASQRAIHDAVQVTKAVKEYLRSLESGAPYGPAEAYRRISQRLNKRDARLLQEFHAKISEHEQQATAAA